MRTPLVCALALCACAMLGATRPPPAPLPAPLPAPEDTPLDLGNFSVSLAVKDLATSRAFYEKLGFEVIGGQPEANYLILQNATATIGLFQGMFERNILTFNPGWDRQGGTLDDFEDVRDLQAELKQRGVELEAECDPAGSGPGSFVIVDPDGNPILVDQHVGRPEK